MQDVKEFQYIKSVNDFQSMSILMDKISKEFKVYDGTKVTADEMSIATHTKANSFISTLSNEDLQRLIQYLKQHNSCYLKASWTNEYTGDYECLKDARNQNAFVQFSNQFYALLNQKIVNSYLTSVISNEQKPQVSIDYLMHHMIIANDTLSSLRELKEIINDTKELPNQKELLDAIDARINRLENIKNINTENIPHLTLQEAQEILSHIDYTYTQRCVQQPEIFQTIIPLVQSQIQNIQNLLFIQNITDAYIQQLENDIQNNSYLKNKETTQEIKLIIEKAREFLLNEESTPEKKLSNFQDYLEKNAATLQKNRNQFPYLLLKILLTGIIGYVLYRLLIGSKAPNLVKLINHEYQNSLQSKILYQTPNPFRPS